MCVCVNTEKVIYMYSTRSNDDLLLIILPLLLLHVLYMYMHVHKLIVAYCFLMVC